MPNAIPFEAGFGKTSYLIPRGTPWPKPEERSTAVHPPGGTLALRDWAAQLGKPLQAARHHASNGNIPGLVTYGPYRRRAVPIGTLWPAKPTGRPRNSHPQAGTPGSTQGAGESLGGRPAPMETP